MSALFGRDREIAALLETVDEGGPSLVFIHGHAGIGKSALLREFRAQAAARGAAVAHVDCRTFQPTEYALVDALGQALGRPLTSSGEALRALGGLGDVVVLSLDTYELFRLSDTWMRTIFAPRLDPRVHLVLAGREPPMPSWFDARGDPAGFRSLRLEPLDDNSAVQALERAGMSHLDARAVNRVARGHPLALQIAGVALQERPGLRVEEAAIPRVVEELARLFVGRLNPETRRLLDAASVVRRVTADLLSGMLPETYVKNALDSLAALPFVEKASDGLRLHESVQEAIASSLRSLQPEAHRQYRAAAWKQLRRQLDEAPRSELWRYTADLLYLLENPAVREAFFPTTSHLYSVEPAQPEDRGAVFQILDRYQPPEAGEVLRKWWQATPHAFSVVRDRAGTVVGFSTFTEAGAVPYGLATADPVLAEWREHLRRNPLPAGQRALFDRCELSRDHGEAPSDVQAAIWLEIKRTYMQIRPHLGRLYSVMADPVPYLEALKTLGFSPAPAPVHLGKDFSWAWLDFGPDSVDGWLARLAAAELGVHEEGLLDTENRELVLDGARVALTPLEFGVLKLLIDRKGRAVSRAALIEKVWGHSYTGGSNVVDVVIRSLRKKLGAKRSLVETVRGAGYRFTAGIGMRSANRGVS